MPTVREDIAQIRKLVNSVSLDTRITNQYIYNKIIDVAKLIVRRDADSRKIYNTPESFATIDCLELEEVELKNCTNIWIPGCVSVMRSKKKLPKTFLSGNGSILNVFSIDRSVQFIQTTPSKFTAIQQREFKGNQKYFWIQDDYVVIPNSKIVAVTVDGLFIDRSSFSYNSCLGILDSDSPIPDSLRMDIFRNVATEIGNIMMRIPPDASPELNPNKKN